MNDIANRAKLPPLKPLPLANTVVFHGPSRAVVRVLFAVWLTCIILALTYTLTRPDPVCEESECQTVVKVRKGMSGTAIGARNVTECVCVRWADR